MVEPHKVGPMRAVHSIEVGSSTLLMNYIERIFSCDQVGTKTRAECVQFYYVWKKLNVEDCRRLRSLRRRRQLRSAAKNFT